MTWYDKLTEYRVAVGAAKAVLAELDEGKVPSADEKEKLSAISQLCRIGITRIDESNALYEQERANS